MKTPFTGRAAKGSTKPTTTPPPCHSEPGSNA